MSSNYAPDKNRDIKGSTWTNENLTTIDANVDGIKTITDALPDSVWSSTQDTTPAPGSRECALTWAGGLTTTKTGHVLDGDGAQADNIFVISGTVVLLEILALVTAVGDATTLSGCKFAVNDGTNTINLTDAIDGSGTVVGSKFVKTAVAATALTHLKADQIRIAESSFNKPFVETVVNGKDAVTNYLQFLFTGADDDPGPATNVTVTFCVRWCPMSDGATVTAVA